MKSEEWKNTFTKKVSWFNEKIIPEQIFANYLINVNYINSIWFHDLLHFMAESNITVYTTEFLTVNYQRNNDKRIMSEGEKLHLSK